MRKVIIGGADGFNVDIDVVSGVSSATTNPKERNTPPAQPGECDAPKNAVRDNCATTAPLDLENTNVISLELERKKRELMRLFDSIGN